ncbi:hypothetical protein [Streptomyces coeruleofuscus]|uniref:hypothetical protein n=1 Tax=Streptomyces coeruleofuscus TaxID=66879 RepID=UPI0031F95DDF
MASGGEFPASGAVHDKVAYVIFDRSGKRMLVAEAEKSTVTTYQVKRDGRLKVLQEPLANVQEILCMDKHGTLSLTNEVGIAAV